MKGLLIVLLFIILISSCNKPIGKWSDNIHLSGKNFTFNSGRDSVLITTKGKWWWINFAKLDSTITYIPSNTTLCDFEFSDTNYQIIRKSCDTLIVKMNENKTNVSRVLIIGFQAGDYFDAVQISQHAE